MGDHSAFQSIWTNVTYDAYSYRIHTAQSQERAGTLPTVVFIPGLGASGRSMVPAAALLRDDRQVLIVDLPSHGESDNATRALDLPGYAAVLAAWLDTVGIEQAVWVGHSFGAQVLVELVLERPDVVTRLALISLTVDPRSRTMSAQFLRLLVDATREPPALLRLLTRDYLQTGLRTLFRNGRLAIADPVELKLPAIEKQALIICGARDPLVPKEWAEEIAALLPHARLVIVPDAPHAVQYVAASAVAKQIEELAS
jgi:2-hydroxy-6-oxonona-2,4-dienedioate hydrolase